MSRWFRMYADSMRNPKVAKLTDREFRLWVHLLSIAAENDGAIPASEDLKRVLNARLDHLLSALKSLISAGLIDPLEAGYRPHNWDTRQYKSDTSTDRVRAFREKRNVSETPPDTEQIQNRAETEKKVVGADAPNVIEFSGGKYEFEGETIKAAPATMKRFRSEFPNLTDLPAALRVVDAYYTHEKPLADPTKWFFPVYRWLEKENREAYAKRREATRGVDWW